MAFRKKQRKNTWGCNNGQFQSLINGRTVNWAGTIMRDLLFFLEYEHGHIASYLEQPFTLLAELENGKERAYTSDILVVYKDGSMYLVECKPAARLLKEHTKRQIALGQAWAEEMGQHFIVVTDEMLRKGPKLASLKLLYKYARLQVASVVAEGCRAYLQAHPQGVSFLTLATHVAYLHSCTFSTPLPIPRRSLPISTLSMLATSSVSPGVAIPPLSHASPATANVDVTEGVGVAGIAGATGHKANISRFHPDYYADALVCSPIIYNLLFRHVLWADLDQPLTPHSLIFGHPIDTKGTKKKGN